VFRSQAVAILDRSMVTATGSSRELMSVYQTRLAAMPMPIVRESARGKL
jgi:hypothetical protein